MFVARADHFTAVEQQVGVEAPTIFHGEVIDRAEVGPGRLSCDLELGRGAARMPVPLRVVLPRRAGELVGFPGAGRDRQDRIAIASETRPDARHPRGDSHQKSTSGIMPAGRAQSFAASSRRWSQ